MKTLKSNKIISIVVLSALIAFNTNVFAQSNEESTSEGHASISSDILQNNPQANLRLKLLNDVKEKKFGTDSIKKYVNEHPSTEYVYYSHDSANVCKTVYNFFTFCQSSLGQISKKLINNKVDIDAKKEELSKAIEDAKNIMDSGSGIYYLLETDNKVIVIDTNYPLEANPVAVQNGAISEQLGMISAEVNDQGRNAKEVESKQLFGGMIIYSSSSISK